MTSQEGFISDQVPAETQTDAFLHNDDPRLDFTSAEFDALLALNTPGLQPPNPRVRPLDNVSQAVQLLPPHEQAALGRRGTPTETKQKLPERKDYKAIKVAREEASKSVLQQIADRVQDGPLMLLKRCCEQRSRVRVITRHAHGVRGVATGTLWAFDKHMNMVLRNVQEEYTVRLWILREKDGGQQGRSEPWLSGQVASSGQSNTQPLPAARTECEHQGKQQSSSAAAPPLGQHSKATPSSAGAPVSQQGKAQPLSAVPTASSQQCRTQSLSVGQIERDQDRSRSIAGPVAASQQGKAQTVSVGQVDHDDVRPSAYVRPSSRMDAAQGQQQAEWGNTLPSSAETTTSRAHDATQGNTVDFMPDDVPADVSLGRRDAVTKTNPSGDGRSDITQQGRQKTIYPSVNESHGPHDQPGLAGDVQLDEDQSLIEPHDPEGAAGGDQTGRHLRFCPVQDHRTRTLKQVYLRGANVVLVSLVQ